MAFNFVGYPIGAALAGAIAAVSIDAAIVVGAVSCLLAGLVAAVMIPRREAPIGVARVAGANSDADSHASVLGTRE
jgi:hypothetical protein